MTLAERTTVGQTALTACYEGVYLLSKCRLTSSSNVVEVWHPRVVNMKARGVGLGEIII
jgi:hypothetical protein